tara:strand:- start:80 stop:532 length:453 start_codon:yes stop_codon:yes gene_type:complete
MISKEIVQKLALEKISELGCFLVDVKVSAKNDITVLFDSDLGVVVKDCMLVSRHIEDSLDRDIEDYQLTVCSPGIDKPFIVNEQYQKNIGKEVKIKTTEGNKIKGKLISFDQEVIVETQNKVKKNKGVIVENINIPIDKIKETKLIIKFK